jgi:hypothetical protein
MLDAVVGKSDLKVAVFAICKNENPYILEWVAYQKLVGFDKVFVYDNVSDDGTSETLIRLHNEGEITRIFWPRLPDVAPQRSAYADFLERFASEFDWAMMCDLDEFLCVDDGDVKGFISKGVAVNASVSAIAVPWLIFGASGHEKLEDDLVVNRFDHCQMKCARSVKSLFRPSDTFNIRTHIVDIGCGEYVDNEFSPAVWSNIAPTDLHKPNFGGARIHHYFTKSRGEWEVRKSLGRADRSEIELRNLEIFERYVSLDGRNEDLKKYSAPINQYVTPRLIKNTSVLDAGIVFVNEDFIVLNLKGEYSSRPDVRVVVNDILEVVSSNLIKLHDGSFGVSINITRLSGPLSKIRISEIESGNSFTWVHGDFPTRKAMLKSVLRLMPSAEMMKFNLFRRLSSTEQGCKYLAGVDFGGFPKYPELQDFIQLLKLREFSKLSAEDVQSYLEKHSRAGENTLKNFKKPSHFVGGLLP